VPAASKILGIPDFDKPLAGALPDGWLGILTGASATGAPILAKQFAAAGVGGPPVLFYTTYERSKELEASFREFGWDPTELKIVNLAEEYYERVLARSLEAARVRERGLTVDDLKAPRSHERALTPFRLTDRLLSDLSSIDAPFRLVIDSVDFFLEVLDPTDVMRVARQIRYRCQSVGGQALLAAHSLRHDSSTAMHLEDLADVVLDFRAEPQGEKFTHTLHLAKAGRRPDLARLIPARLGDSGWLLADGTGKAR
jgi:KaiC/GvpD/RAD55 family RecA-like ATPase